MNLDCVINDKWSLPSAIENLFKDESYNFMQNFVQIKI